MGNPKLIPYETIVRATSGEPEAVEEVLRHYSKRIRVRMLMYSKEASNQKQEIDRQHHTIPYQRNQRAKDKHCGNVYNLLFRHGKARSQHMEKLKSSFPTSCKQSYPQFHKIASYTHSHNADYYEIPPIFHIFL